MNKGKKALSWVYNMPTCTKDDLESLQFALRRGYLYLARDAGGGLYAYRDQPVKYDAMWGGSNGHEEPCKIHGTFKGLTFDCEVATPIKEILLRHGKIKARSAEDQAEFDKHWDEMEAERGTPAKQAEKSSELIKSITLTYEDGHTETIDKGFVGTLKPAEGDMQNISFHFCDIAGCELATVIYGAIELGERMKLFNAAEEGIDDE